MALVALLSTGPLSAPLSVGTSSGPSAPSPSSPASGPASAVDAAALDLPLAGLPSVDLGTQLGLPAGQLGLDGQAAKAALAAANHYALHGRWTAYPLGPAAPVKPDGSFAAYGKRLGLDPDSRARLALLDAGLGGDQGGRLTALEAQEDLQALGRRIDALADSMPGGRSAFYSLLDREARGERLSSTEQARIDSRLTDSLRLDLQPPMSLAQLLWPAFAGQSPAPANPWAGRLSAPVVGKVDAAAVAAQARGVTDPVALMGLAYGVTPRSTPAVSFGDAVRDLAQALHEPLTAAQLQGIDQYGAALDASQAAALARTIEAVALATGQVEDAYTALSPALAQELQDALGAPQVSPGSQAKAELDPDDVIALVQQAVDNGDVPGRLAQAVADVMATVGSLRDGMGSASAAIGALEVPGVLYVGGAGDDDIGKYPLVIEPSGNDHYEPDLGIDTCTVVCGIGQATFVIDLEGDDVQESTSNTNYCGSAGGAYYGLSVLADLLGNDEYSPGACASSLGGGYVGLGVLWDAAGNDTYDATFTPPYPSPTMLGAGTLGVGFALDSGGNDRYAVDLVDSGMALGGAYEGAGYFQDTVGDDKYVQHGRASVLAAAVEGASRFLDLEGKDTYQTRGAGYGYAEVGAATFLDTDGVDDYDVGSYAPAQCVATGGACSTVGNDRAWIGRNSPMPIPICLAYPCPSVPNAVLAANGVDLDLGIPGRGNVQARIADPRSGASIATDEPVGVTVAAINTGSQAVTSVTGVVAFVTSTDDATPGQVLDQKTVDFGTVPANGRVDRVVQWRTPTTDREVQVRLALAGAGDADASDNSAVASAHVRDVQDVSVRDLYVTASGKVRPGMAIAPTVQLENRGNVAYDALPVTLTVSRDGSGASTDTVQAVALARPSPFYDAGNQPVILEASFPTTAPSQEGTYTFTVSVPSDANADPTATSVQKKVNVQIIRDLAVSPERNTFLADPGFFAADGGYRVVVRNTGTLPMSGATLALKASDGVNHADQTFAVPDLDADQAMTFLAPSLPRPPAAGDQWAFTGSLVVANDAIPANNQFTRSVLFANDIVQAFDFEDDDASQSATPDSRWERGLPSFTTSPSALAGPQVWSTGLSGTFPSPGAAVNHDLVLHGIDLTTSLDPRMEFLHTALGTYGSAQYNYGLVYSVAAAVSGTDDFERLVPEGDYPCQNNANGQLDAGPGWCQTFGWQIARIDLARYTGQRIDLRFRASTPDFLYGSYRGWTIDDLRIFGVRRIDQDLQVQRVDLPGTILSDQPVNAQVVVRNNGFTPIDGIHVRFEAVKGTTGAPFALTVPGPSTLQPLEVGTYSVAWRPNTASLYSLTGQATTTGADPRSTNNALTQQVPVYELVADLDPETADASQWSTDASITPNDWHLGVPGSGNVPRAAATGTKVWATNLNGPYTAPDDQNGQYTLYETLKAPSTAIAGDTPGDHYLLSFQHQFDLTSYYSSYFDVAYATATVNGVGSLLAPPGGYPLKGQGMYWSPRPPGNDKGAGFIGANGAYETALLPLPPLKDGDIVRPEFNLYANYCYQCERGSGWTLDDIRVLRAPRFDRDLSVTLAGPIAMDVGQTAPVHVRVTNLGRLVSPEVPIEVSGAFDDGPVTTTTQVPVLQPGESRLLDIPLAVPPEVGMRTLSARLLWPLDEWSANDADEGVTRVARLIFADDFEQGPGGFSVVNGDWQHGTRPDAPNIDGTGSWFTTFGSGQRRQQLAFPHLNVDTGVIYPQVKLGAQIQFDGYGCPGMYSPENFLLSDQLQGELLELAPARLETMYTYYAPAGKGMCVDAKVGDPLLVTADLTHRQAPGLGGMDLRYDVNSYYPSAGGGAEIDDVAVYAIPYTRNVGVARFVSPSEGVLGPGEETIVRVEVAGGGLGWPQTPVALRISSNDALGAGGAPSLDQTVPIAPMPLNERTVVSVPWRPATSLDGQSLQLQARLVDASTGLPLVDEQPADDLVTIPVSILSIHHMALTLVADPNVDPVAVRPVNVMATVSNLGTRTESNVQLRLRYLDDAGLPLRPDTVFPALQKQPDTAQAPVLLSESFTPPGPGHYDIQATLSYTGQLADIDPSRHAARTQVYAGRLPDRLGSTFDGADVSDGWTALGGLDAAGGFQPRDDLDAVQGTRYLASGPYEPLAHYEYTLVADVPEGATASMAWVQRLDLGAGALATVQGSKDNGATWSTLATYQGQRDWSAVSVDLAPVRGGVAMLRFLLTAGPAAGGQGWDIDDVKVLSGGVPVRHEGFEDPLGQLVKSWDFETGPQGWTHDGYAPTGASSGVDDWEQGAPGPASGLAPHGGSGVWKTNLEGDYTMPCTYATGCPSPDNTYGPRRLVSPAFTVPTGRSAVALAWWQWLQVYSGGKNCYSSTCYGAGPDLASAYLLVGGQTIPIQPSTGYGTRGPDSRAPGGQAWSGSSQGWVPVHIDLTPYAGQQVQVVFQLDTAASATDYYRAYSYAPLAGSSGGYAIDDVRLLAAPADPQPNTAVAGVHLDATPVGGRATPITVHLSRTAGQADAEVTFEWVGAAGHALPVPDAASVHLAPGDTSVQATLPAVEPQRSLLRVRVAGGTDARPADDVLAIPVTVESLVYGTAFGASGDSACAKASPCLGWTHNAISGADEWEHGSIPANKYPGDEASQPFAFATDISGRTYEVNSKYRLLSPQIAVPATGATLRFRHAMEANAYSTYYFDGGRVQVNGATLQPDGGYTLANCGYYADSQPCWTGKFPWRDETVSLDAYAGRNVKLDFQFTAGPADYPVADPPASGWSIDDVIVTAPPLRPEDMALLAPASVKVDALDPRPFAIPVANLGTETNAPGLLEAVFARDGVPLPAVRVDVRGLAPGTTGIVQVPLPPGSLDGLRASLRLLTGGGAPWVDDDPSDDVAALAIAPTYVAGSIQPLAGLAPRALNPDATPMRVAAPPSEAGAPALAYVAGFGVRPAFEQGLLFPAVAIPPDAELEFSQRVAFTGKGDGALVEASTDGGRTWMQLDPLGGYPSMVDFSADTPCSSSASPVGRCFSGDLPWQRVTFPLGTLAGQTAWLRLRYSNTATTAEGGWAVGELRITAPGQSENLLQDSRWQAGPITNPGGPLEEATQPNAWSTGLATDAGRQGSFDVLLSPGVGSRNMLDPTVGFDWYGAPEAGASLLVQARDTDGAWRTVGTLSGSTNVWRHAEFPLGPVGDWTQVRFANTVPASNRDPRPAPGFFVDNVVVGSLRSAVEVLAGDGGPVDAHEASNLTLPVRVSNPGAFTNKVQLEVRGADPTWTGSAPPPITLAPGQAVLAQVTVQVPLLRDAGLQPLLVLARSVFDPLQAAVDEVQLNVTVAPKPDYAVKSLGFQSSFLIEGDPVRHVEDARPNTLIAEIENVGLAPGLKDLEVLFLEHRDDGETRPIDVVRVPKQNLTEPGAADHSSYAAFVEWFPRKGVVGVEAVANPEAIGNRFPANPESAMGNNAVAVAVAVEPRPLPELTYAAPPAFSRLPQVGLPVTLGVDVRNGGNAPSLTPVDVALLASPQDAFLTSPPLTLPSHSLLRIVYSSDLELRSDGFVVEALREDGSWQRIQPLGGYPNGCLLSLGCESGVSGRAEHRQMTFDLAGLEGPSQLRFRFAQDSHNGRTFDGLQLQQIVVEQFLHQVYRYDFGSSTAGWTPSPEYTAKDGSAQTLFRYRPREGPVPGVWAIPTNYANPYLVAVRSVKAIGTGALEHVDLDWSPRAGGDTDLVLFIDPKNSEPEYLDDLNLRTFQQRVAVSGFELRPTAPPCGTAAICLPDAGASADLPLRLANTGNTRSHFELRPQEHPFLDAAIRIGDRDITGIELEAGQQVDAVLHLQAHAAPAAVHTVQVDVLDSVVGKTTRVGIAVKVLSTGTAPLKVVGLHGFDVVATAKQSVSLQNPSNQVVPVLLRAGDKPSGLAVRVSPNEFTLAPFESRAIEIELLNLGVVPKAYTFDLVNARAACPVGQPDCGAIAALVANITDYAPPTADWKAPAQVRTNAPVAFADQSKSVGSTIVSWHWDFGDGESSTQQAPAHAYAKPGVYAVTLTVKDGQGQSGQSSPRSLTVVNDVPKAMAVLGTAAPVAGMPVNFSANRSADPDGTIAKVTWAFGDGSLGSGLEASHVYRVPGTYRVVVAVEDAFGAVDVYEMQVTVAGLAPASAAGHPAKDSPSLGLALPALALVGLALLRRRRA